MNKNLYTPFVLPYKMYQETIDIKSPHPLSLGPGSTNIKIEMNTKG